MKWTNKGHQFDRFSEIFSNEMKVYIYGAGENGKDLFSRMMFADCVEAFIDNDVRKVGGKFCGKEILSLNEFITKKKEKHIVVIAQALGHVAMSKKQLLLEAYTEGIDLFDYHTFIEFYLPIYAMYSWNKVYVPSVSLVITTLCNLDCKGCLAFIHSNKNQKHYALEDLTKDVDCIFSKVDRIGLFHLTGGEPLLYPYFSELVNYIIGKYKNKIFQLGTTTNGTVVPADEICKEMKKAEMYVWVDDYRKNVSIANKKFDSVKKKLEDFGVNYYTNYVDEWIDISKILNDNTENVTIAKCTLCAMPFAVIKDQKLYGCNYSEYACRAGVIINEIDDFLNLSEDYENKKIILEYIMGYTQKGYYSFCSMCEGFCSINTKKIPVAEQYSI